MVLREKDVRHKFSVESYIGYPTLRQTAIPLAASKDGKKFEGLLIKAFKLDPYVARQFIYVDPRIVYKKHYNEKGPLLTKKEEEKEPILTEKKEKLLLTEEKVLKDYPALSSLAKKNISSDGLFYPPDVLFNDNIVNDVYPSLFGKSKNDANPLEMSKGQKILLENGGWIVKPMINFSQISSIKTKDGSVKYSTLTKKSVGFERRKTSLLPIKKSFVSEKEFEEWIKPEETENFADPYIFYKGKNPSSMEQINLCRYGTSLRARIQDAYFKDFMRVTGYGLYVDIPESILNKKVELQTELEKVKESSKIEELDKVLEKEYEYRNNVKAEAKNIFSAINNVSYLLSSSSLWEDSGTIEKIDIKKGELEKITDPFERSNLEKEIDNLERSLSYTKDRVRKDIGIVKESYKEMFDLLTPNADPEKEKRRIDALIKLNRVNNTNLPKEEASKTKFEILPSDSEEEKTKKVDAFVRKFSEDYRKANINNRINACKIVTVLNSLQNHKGWHNRIIPNKLYGDVSENGINDPETIDTFLNANEDSIQDASFPNQVKLALKSIENNARLLNICKEDDPTACIHPDEIQNLGLYGLRKHKLNGGIKEYKQSNQYQFPEGMSIFTFIDVPLVFYRLTSDTEDRYKVFSDLQQKVKDSGKDYISNPELNIRSLNDLKRVSDALKLSLTDYDEGIPFMPFRNSYNSKINEKREAFNTIYKKARKDILDGYDTTTAKSFPKVKEKWSILKKARDEDISEMEKYLNLWNDLPSKSVKEKEEIYKDLAMLDEEDVIPTDIDSEIRNLLKTRLTISDSQYYGIDTDYHFEPIPVYDKDGKEISSFKWKEMQGCLKGSFDVTGTKRVFVKPSMTLVDGDGNLIRWKKVDKDGKEISLSIPEIQETIKKNPKASENASDPKKWKWLCIGGTDNIDRNFFENQNNVPFGLKYVDQRRAINIYKNNQPSDMKTIDEALVKDSVANALRDIAKTAFNAIQIGSIASMPAYESFIKIDSEKDSMDFSKDPKEFITKKVDELSEDDIKDRIEKFSLLDTLINPDRFNFDSIQQFAEFGVTDVDRRNKAFFELLKKVEDNQEKVGTQNQWAVIYSLIKDGNPNDYINYIGKDNRVSMINVNSIWVDPSQNAMIRRRKNIKMKKFGLPDNIYVNPFDLTSEGEKTDTEEKIKKIKEEITESKNPKEKYIRYEMIVNLDGVKKERKDRKKNSVIAIDTNLRDIFLEISNNQQTPSNFTCGEGKVFDPVTKTCKPI